MILVAAFPIDWLATVYVLRKAKDMREGSLTFTAGGLVAASAIASVGAVLSAGYLAHIAPPPDLFGLSLAASFLIAAAIAPTWVLGFALGKFR